MRSLTLFCFLTTACAMPKAMPVVPAEDVRTIRACIVNDASAPARDDIIRAALAEASSEYEEKVGIRFVAAPAISAAFEPSGWPMDNAFFLRKVCPDDAEIRIVFTDRFVAPNQVSMTAKGEGGQMAGDAHPYYGFVIAYSANERWRARDAGAHPALVSTLKHEIGHLFGLEHDTDRRSFMYESSNASRGYWTDDAIDRIRAAKWKRWWPRA